MRSAWIYKRWRLVLRVLMVCKTTKFLPPYGSRSVSSLGVEPKWFFLDACVCFGFPPSSPTFAAEPLLLWQDLAMSFCSGSPQLGPHPPRPRCPRSSGALWQGWPQLSDAACAAGPSPWVQCNMLCLCTGSHNQPHSPHFHSDLAQIWNPRLPSSHCGLLG